MNIQEMVNNYNENLLNGEESITFSEMCVLARSKGLIISQADTAKGYIEDMDARLTYLESKYAKMVWTDDEIQKTRQSYLEHRAFWQNEFNRCKALECVKDIEITRQASNLDYAIRHKLGTDAQRQDAIDRFIEKWGNETRNICNIY